MEQVKTILYVDDDKDSLELTKFLFEVEGYEVVTCTTHQEGFKQLSNYYFSAIILDLRLEDKDGVEMCSEIRTNSQHIPIVFYTADATTKSRERCLRAGANAYLVKPNDFDNLVPTVTKLIMQSSFKKAESYLALSAMKNSPLKNIFKASHLN